MESYLDNSNSKPWIKVLEITDNGGDMLVVLKVFTAQIAVDQKIIWFQIQDSVTFRANNVVLNFKNQSIKEIEQSVKR